MHEAKFGIEEIVVQDALRPRREDQARPTLTMSEFDGAAGFHDLEHGDQALLLRAFAEEVLDEFLLLGPALEGLIGNAGLGGRALA